MSQILNRRKDFFESLKYENIKNKSPSVGLSRRKSYRVNMTVLLSLVTLARAHNRDTVPLKDAI